MILTDRGEIPKIPKELLPYVFNVRDIIIPSDRLPNPEDIQPVPPTLAHPDVISFYFEPRLSGTTDQIYVRVVWRGKECEHRWGFRILHPSDCIKAGWREAKRLYGMDLPANHHLNYWNYQDRYWLGNSSENQGRPRDVVRFE